MFLLFSNFSLERKKELALNHQFIWEFTSEAVF